MLTGPNLPHNWVSDMPPGDEVPLRGRVVQFTEDFIADAMRRLPELAALRRHARAEPPRGCSSAHETSGRVGPDAGRAGARRSGVRRIELFMRILGALSRARRCRGR